MCEGKARPLSPAGLEAVQSKRGVDAPALWAVLTVETRGCGFLQDRRPVILFERHWFSRLTNRMFDAAEPDISARNAGGYGAAGGHQHDRLSQAIAHDRKAALESASWGLGQVMGFNAGKVGFADAESMVNACMASEDGQLLAMAGFIDQANLARHLQSGAWAKFAYSYNGEDFQKNKYDEKLGLAHRRFQQGPLPNLVVRTAQLGLMILGYGGPGFVDGWYGGNTQRALIRYQRSCGLTESGVSDQATTERMKADLGW